AKPFLDQVWVVSRIGGHHEHPPRRWVERDNRTALAAQQPPGQSLRTRPDGQHEVVTGYRGPLQLVESGVEDRVEVGVRASEVIVVRLLEPGSIARLGRVPDDVGEDRPGRIAPKV